MSLAAQVEALMRRLNDFPETHTPNGPVLKPDAFVAFLDLRKLMTDQGIAALYKLESLERRDR